MNTPVLEVDSGVATITLRRPMQHNRIDAADPHVILRYLDEVSAMRDVVALVITGSGPRTFCAGYTLGQIESNLDHSFEAIARAIRIAHGTGDGDTGFALATGTVPGTANVDQIGSAAADVLSRAIIRALLNAKSIHVGSCNVASYCEQFPQNCRR